MAMTLVELGRLATTIVVARFDGADGPGRAGSPLDAARYRLTVERTLRGTVKPGPWVVMRSAEGMPSVPVGARVVAFVDDAGRFRWAGTLKVGARLEDGVIELAGFYDWNAYLVSPSLLTLGQLDRWLATGEIRWTFEGKLHFAAPGAAAPVASAIALTVELAGADGSRPAKVGGMPKLAGFPETPTVHVSSGFEPDVHVIYDRNLYRPLELSGKIVGVDPATARMEVVFWVASPEVLTEPLFRKYVADPKLGGPVHEIAVVLDDGTRWTLRLGEAIGHIGTVSASSGRTHEIGEMSTAPERWLRATLPGGGSLQINLAAADPKVRLFTGIGSDGTILHELLAAPIGCTLWVSGGKSPRSPVRGRLELVTTTLIVH